MDFLDFCTRPRPPCGSECRRFSVCVSPEGHAAPAQSEPSFLRGWGRRRASWKVCDTTGVLRLCRVDSALR